MTDMVGIEFLMIIAALCIKGTKPRNGEALE
jgi:hypothetical protein